MAELIPAQRSIWRDVRGVAAVEFALVAPIMLLLYFGLAELTQASIAERRVTRAASAIGDLVAQRSTITATGTGGITDVFAIAPTLLKPFAAGTALKICVASIVSNAQGQKTVAWTQNQNDSTCPARNANMSTVSNDVLGPGQSVIMSRVTYKYTSPLNEALKTNPTFVKTLYLRPRRSASVTCDDC